MTLTRQSIKYINSNGMEISFSNLPYVYRGGDYFNYKWEHQASVRVDGLGSKINQFVRTDREFKLPVQIYSKTREGYRSAIKKLSEVFETDIINRQCGKLYVNDTYIPAYIIGSDKADWDNRLNIMTMELTACCPSAFWITEKTQFFSPSSQTDERGKKYPYKYQVKYGTSNHMDLLDNDHYAPSKMVIRISGVAIEPAIYIGGHLYEVNITISNNEYIEINQMKHTITKTIATGEVINEFDKRNKESDIFKPAPAGLSRVLCNDDYSFEVTLLQERSEPRWN